MGLLPPIRCLLARRGLGIIETAAVLAVVLALAAMMARVAVQATGQAREAGAAAEARGCLINGANGSGPTLGP